MLNPTSDPNRQKWDFRFLTTRSQDVFKKFHSKGVAKRRFCQRIVRAKKFSEKYAQKWLIKTPFSQRIVEGYFLIEKSAKAPCQSAIFAAYSEGTFA